MDYFENVLEAVGNTPLIRLGRIERDEGIEATLLAKVEYLNPAGSVKDRPAVKMLEIAEKEGLLEARRDRRRADEREHGGRPGHGRSGQRLQVHLRDAG